MKKIYCNLFCGVFFLLINLSTIQATHIVGGEMNYRCLGNNQYEITLTVYRDCETSTVQFDDPATIGVYDGNGALVQTRLVNLKNESMLNATLADSCLVAPPSACIRQALYVDTVSLPVLPQGYVFSYQRCCRNNTIVNIVSPGQTGATYFIELTEAAMLSCNSSPIFRDLPNVFLCQGVPLVFDHSVIDAEGDSIVYELCAPYEGASSGSPMSNAPPPYTNITFNPPYSVSAMLGTIDSLKIDSVTGILTGTPAFSGVFLVGVCAKEYRNGVLLSTTIRDFQYKVGACQPAAVARFDQSFHNCDDLEYQFSNISTRHLGGFWWDFNGLGTSTQTNPTFTFPAPGIYTITLVAGAGTPCADTTVGTIDVQIRTIDLSITPPLLACAGDTIKIGVVDAYSNITGPSTYTWGPANRIVSGQGTDSISIIAANNLVVHVSGVNNFSCQSSAITTIHTLNKAVTYDTIQPLCNTSLTVDFQNPFSTNLNLTDYLWDFDGLGTSTLVNPSFTFPDTGKYDVVLYVGATTTTCADTFYLHVNLELSGLDLTPLTSLFPLCGGDSLWLSVENSLQAYAGTTSYTWTPSALFSAGQGTDSVLLIGQQDAAIAVYVENSYGCRDTLRTVVDVTLVEASFDTLDLTCNTSLIIPFQNTSITNPVNNNYLWIFDTLGTSTAIHPTYTFPDTGHYTIQLVAGASSIPGLMGLCQDTATLDIYLPLEGIELAPLAAPSICNGDSVSLKAVDIYAIYSSSTQYVWTSTGSPIVTGQGTDSIFLQPNQPTTVSLVATNNHGCSDTVETTIDVVQIEADFSVLATPCNTSLEVTFQNATNTNVAGLNYQWNFAGLANSTLNNPTYTFPDTGQYSIELIAGQGNACVDTIELDIQVAIEGIELQPMPAQTVCKDALAMFKVIDLYDAYSSSTQYNWTINNGSIVMGQGTDSVVIDPNPNTAVVTVVATNNYGCIDTMNSTVQVDLVAAVFDSLELPCNTSLVIPFVNTTTTNMSNIAYQWDFAGLGTATTPEPMFTFPDTGTYTVTLIAGIQGRCLDTLSMDVYLPLEGVDLQAIPSQTICEGDSAQFHVVDLLDAYSSTTQYIWTSTATILDGQGTDSLLVTALRPATVEVVATNNHGCSDTTNAILNVSIVDADFEMDTVPCNTSLEVGFTNLSTSNLSTNLYQWELAGGGNSTSANPTFTFPDTGNYIMRLIAGAGSRCPDTLWKPINIQLKGLEISATDAIVFCARDTAPLVATNIYKGYSDFTHYNWQPSNLVLSGQGTDSVQVVIASPTTFTVIGTNSFGCHDTTQAIGTIQYPSPVLSISVSPDSIFVGQTASILATDDLNYTYHWSSDTTLSADDIYNPTARPRVTTTYYLEVENEYGCTSNDSIMVMIREPICDVPVVFVPSAFSPDGDGYNDVLMVNGNNIKNMTMVIYNRWGQKVFETKDQNMGWDGRFNGQELAPDIYGYYMQCTCEKGGTLQLKGSITLLR